MNQNASSRDGRPAGGNLRLTPLAWSIQLALLGTLPQLAVAAPTGGEVKAGSGSVSQSASRAVTTVRQNSQRLAVDWQSFDVAAHERVEFRQPNARAQALNRIFDQKPSEIFGRIEANGRVLLMNPNGVFFKPGAQVNVGGLIAGAMQVGIDEFMSGRYTLKADGNGRVVNQGNIEAAPGGEVALVGQSVANEGVIVATAGTVSLLGADQVTVDFDGDGLLRFAVEREVVDNADALDDQVANSGSIEAPGGEILITASAADGVFKNAINNSGAARAGRIERSGGRILLVGTAPTAGVLNTGQLDASAIGSADDGGRVEVRGGEVRLGGTVRADAGAGNGGSIAVEAAGTQLVDGTVSARSDGARGGTVHLLGDQVGLVGAADVDASGGSDGGEVLVGGDFQGRNAAVRNARHTYVGDDVRIAADAGEEGDGGKVVLWADDSTRFHGTISARGGSSAGDGGNVEVSGKQNLTFAGFVDASALNGAAGNLLLDPGDLYITNGGAPTAAPAATLDGSNPFTATNPNDFYAEEATLEAIAGGTNITLTADNDIIFESDVTLDLQTNSSASVTLTADGDIVMNGADITTQGGDINMNATTAGVGTVTAGGLTTNGGDVNFDVGAAVTLAEAVNVGAGTVRVINSNGGANFAIGDVGTGIDVTNASLANITADTVIIGDNDTDQVNISGVLAASTANIANLTINSTEAGGSPGAVNFGTANSTFNAATSVSINAEQNITIDNVTVTALGAITFDADASGNGSGTFALTNAGATLNVSAAGATITAGDIDIAGVGINAAGQTLTLINSDDGGIGLGLTAVGGYRIAGSEFQRITANVLRLDANGGGNITVDGVNATVSANVASVELLADGDTVAFSGTASTFANDVLVAADTISVSQALTMAGGDLTLRTDNDLTISSTIGAGTNAVFIDGLAAGTQIDLGADNGGDIVIGNTVLNTITAATVTIGGANTNDIRLDNITSPNTDQIGQVNLSALQAGSTLTVQDSASTFVNNISLQAGSITVSIGLTSTGGDIAATSLNGGITVNAAVTASGSGGDIRLETQELAEGTTATLSFDAALAASGDNIALISADGITQGGSGTITADGLAVQAESAPTLTVPTLARLAASITGAGNGFTFSNGAALDITTVLGISGVTTNNGAISLTTTAGALTLSQVVNAGTSTVSLTGATSILDGNAAASNVTATSLTASAATGIDLDTTITTLTSANVTGIGAIDITDTAGGLAVTSATTTDGAITLNATAGDLTVTTVTAAGTGRNVNLATTTSGNIVLGAVTAAGDAVVLNAAGAITDTNGGTANVTAASLTATAATGIDIDTAITTLTNASVTGNGAIDLTDDDALAVSAASTSNGNLTLATVNGSLTVNGAVSAGGGNDVVLTTAETAEGTDAVLDLNALVSAAGGNVVLTSADAITGDGTATAEVAATTLSATAAAGIDLDTNVGTLTLASVTGTGAIDITDNDVLAVTSALTNDGAISLATVNGALSINGAVTAGGAGRNVTLTTAETAEGTDATLDINALVTAAGDAVVLNSADGITDDGTAAAEIAATSLSATSATNQSLDVDIDTLTLASVTAAGTLDITDVAGGLTVTNATTADGTLTLTADGGDLAVTAATASGSGDILLRTTTSGDIVLNGTVTATGDDVALDTADGIVQNAGTVSADGLAIRAASQPGAIATSGTLSRLAAEITGAGNGFTFSTTADLEITTVLGIVGVSTNDGAIDLTVTNGELALTSMVDAGTSTVSLTATTGAITDGNGAAANVVADALSVTAATGISTDTTITTLTSASVTGTGNLDVSDTAGGLAVTSATTNDGNLTLNATGGTLALGTVTAGGTGRDVSLTTTTSGDITLANDVTATGDDIEIRSAGNINQTAGALVSSGLGLEGGSITLGGTQSDIDVLAARLTAAGDFTFTDATDLTIGTIGAIVGVSTTDGSIAIDTVDGFLTVNSVVTAVGAARTVTLTTAEAAEGTNATLDVNALVTAAGDAVTLTSADGITDGGTSASEVSADSLTVTAASGIDLDTTLTTLTNASVTGAGAIDLSDTDALTVLAASTSNGSLSLATVNGALVINGAVSAAGVGSDVNLTSGETGEGTNAVLDINALVTAADAVNLQSADGITDDGTAAAEVSAPNLGIVAAGDVSLDVTVTTLTSAALSGAASLDLFDTAGGLAVTSATTANGNITLVADAGALTVTTVNAAGAGSDVSLTTQTSGNIALGSVTATDAVTLSAAGAITDGNGGTANVIGTSLTATAATGIDTDTTITTLTSANVTGAGNIDISDTAGGLAVTSATTTDGNITLNATGGNLTITTVTANGAGRDASLGTTTSGNVVLGSVTATDVVSLSAAGAVTDANGATANVVAASLTATAATGISTDTTITTLTSANVTGTGAIDIADTAGGLAVTSATTNDGNITLSADGGDLSVTTVTAGGGGDASLTTTTSGDVVLGVVTATGDDVVLTAAGSVTDANGAAANVVASTLTATAATGISTDTTITTLTSASVTGTGNLDVSDTAGGLAVTSATTNDGTVLLNATGGDLTVTTVTAGGANDATLTTTTSGNIVLGVVTAAGDDVVLTAAGSVTDGNGAAANVVADALTATAVTGISTDTTITTLTSASVTGTGNLDVSDTAGGMAVTSATTNDGNLTLNATAGDLVITTVTAGGSGDATLSTTTSGNVVLGVVTASGDDVSLSAAGAITDTNAAAVNVSANTLTATAATGMDIDTAITTLTSASVTGTGDLDITETAGGMSVTSATTSDGELTLTSAGGTLSVTAASAGGAGRDLNLTTTGSGALQLGGAISAAGDTVVLTSAAGISQSAGAVSATNLEVLAASAVTLTSATNAVTTVAGDVSGSGQGFSYADANGLAVGTVNATVGVTTQDGAIVISAGQGGGATLSVDDTIDAGTSTITLAGGGGNDTLAINASLTAGGGSTLQGAAGDDSFVFADTFAASAVDGGGQGASGDLLDLSAYTGAITFTVTAANTGSTSGALTTTFSSVERLTGGSNAGDTLSANGAAAGVTFTITGTNAGTLSLLAGAAPAWQGIENLVGSANGDSFVLNGGDLAGGINGGLGADTFTLGAGSIAGTLNGGGGSDTLTGRNQVSEWDITGSGAGTIDDTPNGAPDGTPEFTFAQMEILQGGSAVDTFDVATGTALSFTEIRGGGSGDTFSIRRNGALSTVLTANLFGEGGADTLVFGVSDPNPPGADNNEHSRLVGQADLGAGIDTIDFSDSDLLLVTNITDNDSGSGQAGTITDLVLAVTNPDPPDVALITFAGDGFIDVDDLRGNGSQLQGADVDTVWVITGFGEGRRGADLDSATNTFENFSIRGGNKRDFFIFKDETGVTPELALGIDGGDVTAGDAATENYLLGSDGSDGFGGADTFAITGANAVTITVNGTSGTASTIAANINHVGDAGIVLTGGGSAFADAAADTITVQAGVVWGGDIFTNGGSDSVTFGNGARVQGTLDLGAGSDTADFSAYTTSLTATVSTAGAAGLVGSTANFADDFAGIENLITGSGADTITFSVAPTDTTDAITVALGGGTDTLRSTVAADWLITGNGAGFLRDPATVARRVAFSGVDDLTSTAAANLTLPSTAGAAASISGTFTATTITLLPAGGAARSVFAGNLGLRLDGNVVSSGPLTLDADNDGIDIDGTLTVDGALNVIADGGGDIALRRAVTADGATVIDANGGGDILVGGDLSSGGALNLQADGAGDITVNGDILADGNVVSTVDTGTATYRAIGSRAERTGNQTFSGNTVIRGDLVGSSLRFNDDVAIAGNVLMSSSTNTFDFRREVTSGADDVLSIEPPAGGEIIIDNTLGAGHLAADAFDGFLGTLVIGGQFAPGSGAGATLFDGSMLTATADNIQVLESFLTGGDLLLIGSTIEFDPEANGGLTVSAGGPGGGDIVLLAMGDTLQGANAPLDGNDNFGNIVGPASGTMTIEGNDVLIAAVGELLNASQMIMDLSGGEVTLAQSANAATRQVTFNVQSDARSSDIDVFDTAIVDSLLDVAQLQVTGPNPFSRNSFQNTRASFPNPAAVLTILQAVSFVDSSLFEEDLSLFGVIGNGVALSLDQCEDAEGCAPSVTEEELDGFIATLQERIAQLEGLMAAGEMSAEEGERLLAGYRRELDNFNAYKAELAAWNARQEADEFGDDFGDEFDDVFEAEETLEPTGDDAGELTEPAEAMEEEAPAEEAFDELEEPAEPAEAEEAAPAEEPAEEAFEEFDEAPAAVDEAPPEEEAPAPDSGEPAFDELEDEFEELEEELDDTLLNELLRPRPVNELAGVVRLGTDGRVSWAGDVVLPSLHRRY